MINEFEFFITFKENNLSIDKKTHLTVNFTSKVIYLH